MLSLAYASLSFAGLTPRASPSAIQMVATSKTEFAYGAHPPAHAPRALQTGWRARAQTSLPQPWEPHA